MTSTQEETNTRVVLYCKHAENKGYKFVKVKRPDSDILFILLHHAHSLINVTILFETGTGNKQRLLNVTEIANNYKPQYCTALISLHGYTGCDSTSASRGIGKVRPMKCLGRKPEFVTALAKLGDDWSVSEDVVDALDCFTCAVYGRPRDSHVDQVRYLKMNELCGDNITPAKNVDMSVLPPC